MKDSPSDSLLARAFIEALGLIPHPEGGYFREVYRSGAEPMRSRGATDPAGALMHTSREPRESPERNVLTSIYYLLDEASPIGWFCHNESAHVHYYHAGSGLTYSIIGPDGSLVRRRLGPDVAAGDVLQLVVEGGSWKACELDRGGFCLLGEAVAPGFDFRDFRFGTQRELTQKFPRVFGENPDLVRLFKPAPDRDFDRYYAPDKA
jgi:predicted cupin superfamily sugar epimerase